MNESIDDRLAETDERLAEIKAEFERMLGRRPSHANTNLLSLGFTIKEAEAWLRQELSYDRPIAETRCDDYADRTIRRKVTASLIRRRLHRTRNCPSVSNERSDQRLKDTFGNHQLISSIF